MQPPAAPQGAAEAAAGGAQPGLLPLSCLPLRPCFVSLPAALPGVALQPRVLPGLLQMEALRLENVELKTQLRQHSTTHTPTSAATPRCRRTDDAAAAMARGMRGGVEP